MGREVTTDGTEVTRRDSKARMSIRGTVLRDHSQASKGRFRWDVAQVGRRQVAGW